MSILASLVRAYDRLPAQDRPPYGYSMEKIGFQISLNPDGTVAHVTDLREGEGKKKQSRMMLVPQGKKRTAGIAPNFLWDKTSYVLGITAGEGKRTADEHAAFVALHKEALGGTEDEGLRALLGFLEAWTPEQFVSPLWPEEMKDQNVVFVLESERLNNINLHDRSEATSLVAQQSEATDAPKATCLVTVENAPVARLHPSIKGVWGAQSSGASISSFNLDAFESYGHSQGDNAPVSQRAAFAYTAALNHFLKRGSGHRIQIGDASTVFWAESDDTAAAKVAEDMFVAWVEPGSDDSEAAKRVGALLERIRRGEQLRDIDPQLADGVRFYVLGLSPNAARLSVRYWFEDDFGALADNYRRFTTDMRIEPAPREAWPPLWRYLRETAVLGKADNIVPNLAGDWMRAILGGTPYPLTLLNAILARIRADGSVNALRASMLKAVLIRNFTKEAPVALDPDETNRGYLLGRLFAVYEEIQRAALGGRVNATIKDKFYGSASATPRRVYPALDRGAANHLAKLGKLNAGRKVNLTRLLGEIMDRMSPADDPFPLALTASEQALFGLGYFHQHNEFFKSRDKAGSADEQGEAQS